MAYWQANTPYLIIPVETRVREFEAKLLLSCVAVEAGFSVVFGWAKQIKKFASYIPRGIIVERSVAAWKLQDFQRYRQLGNQIVAWCEEGLVTLDADFYVRHRVVEDVLGVTDKFFAWGPRQANMIATRIPNSRDKMVVTGNVRFDLLRAPYRGLFEQKVNELKERYGSFILINTNFGHYNNVLGREASFERLKTKRGITNQADADFFLQWSDYAGEMYHHFVAMVAYLNEAFPQHTIVVRPHPSENVARWEQETASFANVRVARDGNVVPWLIAAEVVIHNSCTTGVETYGVGTPVVAYRPITSDRFDASLSNEISKQVTTLPELQATLCDVLARPDAFAYDQQTDPEARRVLNQYVVNLEGPLASEEIVSSLQKSAQQNAFGANDQLNAMRNRLKWRSVGLKNSIWRDTIRPMIKGRTYTYSQHKFPRVSVKEVEDIIADLQKVSGRFEGITVRPLGVQSLFHLQKNDRRSRIKKVFQSLTSRPA